MIRNFLAFSHSRANPVPAYLWRIRGPGAHKRQGNLAGEGWRGFKESGPCASAACLLSQLVGGTEIALSLNAWVKTPPCLGQRYHTQSICLQGWEITESSPCLHPMSTWNQCSHLTWLWHREDFQLLRMPQEDVHNALKLKTAMSDMCWYCSSVPSMCSWP